MSNIGHDEALFASAHAPGNTGAQGVVVNRPVTDDGAARGDARQDVALPGRLVFHLLIQAGRAVALFSSADGGSSGDGLEAPLSESFRVAEARAATTHVLSAGPCRACMTTRALGVDVGADAARSVGIFISDKWQP